MNIFLYLFSFLASCSLLAMQKADLPRPTDLQSLDVANKENQPGISLTLLLQADSVALQAIPCAVDVTKESGHTPQKPTLVSFDGRLTEESRLRVKRITGRKLARRLFLDEPNEPNEPEAKRSCTLASFDTDPSKESTILLVDPAHMDSAVGVNLEHSLWKEQISEIINTWSNINFDQKEVSSAHIFLLLVAREIKLRVSAMLPALLLNVEDKNIDCRAYSVLGAAVLSKIFQDEGSPFYGQVHLLGGDEVDTNWRFGEEGHVWNVVHLAVGTTIKIFYVDVAWGITKHLVKNDPDLLGGIMELGGRRQTQVKSPSLIDPAEHNLLESVIRLSMERVGLTEGKTLFNDEIGGRIALAKFILANDIQIPRSTVITLSEATP